MTLPQETIGVEREGDEIRPRWLTPRVLPAVEALIDAYDGAVGRPQRLLRSRVRRASADRLDPVSRRLVCRVLDDLYPAPAPKEPDPRSVRLALWQAGAAEPERGRAVTLAASRLKLTAEAVEDALFADLPGERRIAAPEQRPVACEVLEIANRRLLQALLCRAEYLVLRFRGATRVLMHAIRRSRLIAEVRAATLLDTEISLSGPLSLHRRTALYGRRLSDLVPAITRCETWSILASGRLHDAPFRLRCDHTDPVTPPKRATPRFDSAVEERFHRDFLRRAEGWHLHREPRPVSSGDGWIFPDFQAHPDGHPERSVTIEIVGFWTPAYLHHKLDRLHRAAVPRALLLVDDSLAVGEDALPPTHTVLRYRRRIDVQAVVTALETLCGPAR